MAELSIPHTGFVPLLPPAANTATLAPPTPAPAPAGDTTTGARLLSLLERFSVPSLFPVARQWLIDGKSEAEILLALRQTEEWKRRFAANGVRRQNGLAELEEEAIVAWENQARAIARAYDLPSGFWDQPDDFTNLIGMNWSVAEYERKVVNGYARVTTAPVEVRDAFGVYFGAQGDAMLAAFFLDPARAVTAAEAAVNAALAGGAGARRGFTVGRDQATRLAQLGLTDDQLSSGFDTLAENRHLLDETVTEGTDLTDDIGAAAVFGTDTASADALKRRAADRQAAASGSSGGYGTDRDGRTGVASNRR